MEEKNCPVGYRSDSITRVPFPEYFQEDFGKDCYYNIASVTAMGAFVIVLATTLIFLSIISFKLSSNREDKLVHGLNICWSLIAIFEELFAFFDYPAVACFLFCLILSVGFIIVISCVRMLYKLHTVRINPRFAITDTIKKEQYSFGMFLVLAVTIFSSVGGFGLFVTLHLTHDFLKARIFHNVICTGVATGGVLFGIGQWIVIGKIIKYMNNISEAKPLLKHFIFIRRVLSCTIPSALFVFSMNWIPLFHYVVIITQYCFFLVAFGIWFLRVPSKQKEKIKGYFRCCKPTTSKPKITQESKEFLQQLSTQHNVSLPRLGLETEYSQLNTIT